MAAGAALAATGLLTAACLQNGGSAAGASGSTTPSGSGSADQAVASAYQVTTQARTARTTMTTRVGVGNESVPITASGVLDFASKAADLTEQLPNNNGTAETRFVNGMLYEHLPSGVVQRLSGGKPWISLDLAKMSQQGDGSLQQLMSDTPTDPSTVLGYLRGAGAQATNLGQDTVDGVSTTHYHVVIDLDKAAAGQDARGQQAIQALEQELGSHTLPADIWLDDQGRLRKVTMQETLRGTPSTTPATTPSASTSERPAANLSFNFTATLTDFGVPVSVTAPPADQTADLTNALGGGH